MWIVTPTYYDVAAFTELRLRIRGEVAAMSELDDTKLRFVVVDDSAGRDVLIKNLPGKDTEIVTPPFNVGHQRAIVYALRNLRERIDADDIVVTLDSDGEDRPEDIPALVRKLLEDDRPHVAVLARRTARRETFQFKVLYACFKFIFRALTGTVIRTGNFAAYRGEALRTIASHPYFDLSYSASLARLDFDTQYIDCPRGDRYAGRSQMGVQGLVMHGLSMLVPFTDRIALRAMLLFTGVFFASILGALVVIGVKLFSDADIPGWATYTLLAFLISSLVALGNFVILFIVFSQSRGVSLSGLENRD